MPNIGRDPRSTFGTIANVPADRQAAVKRGINFFELVWQEPTSWDRAFYGPIDVRVKQNYDTISRRMEFHDTWITEHAAHLQFSADEDEVATAWMPDDKFWKNRLYLMDTPVLYETCMAYHTKRGRYAADSILMEIDCMREILKEEKTFYSVIANVDGIKREKVCYKNKEDAENYIDENSADTHKVDQVTKHIITKRKHSKFFIVEVKKLEYRDEIAELSNRENRKHKFGWTESKEFRNEIRPKIEALIEERKKAPVSPTNNNLLQQVSTMSNDEKAQLAEQLKALLSPPDPSTHSNGEVIEETLELDFDPWETRTKAEYRKTKKDVLQKIYASRNSLNLDAVIADKDLSYVKLIVLLSGQDANEGVVTEEEVV